MPYLACTGVASLSVPAFRSPIDKHKTVLAAICQIFPTKHTAPGNFGLGGFDYEFHYRRISHFSALPGKYSPILGCSNQQH